MGFQNFFAAKLATDIGASDTSIELDTAPTATSGRMSLESRNPTQREIIKYTGLSGKILTGVTRGQGGTTAKSHLKSSLVEMNATGEDLQDLYDAFGSFAASNTNWFPAVTSVTSVTANGNRSYNVVMNTNLTSILSPGMRLRTTRTVAAPTQCTFLNGTTQYWSKTSPNKMTFTDDFVVSAWIKLSSYNTSSAMAIASRFNGTSGWRFDINTDGTLRLIGYNASGTNYSIVGSRQSVPLNKWVHVAAQLDMSSFTATTTTSYIMMDGVDVPCSVARAGTNPTSLIQAGNLEIGSLNGGTGLFPGKIAQVAIFNAKVTQATMLTYISQGLSGSETSLVSAYSFNGVATDLNTTTPNNLTASGSATATNADSPFGGQAGGSISSTLDYGIIQSVAYSTNTTAVVQVPAGCTIPTSGGVSAVSYSSMKAPYGFPTAQGRWEVEAVYSAGVASATPTSTVWYEPSPRWFTLPIGTWDELGYWVEARCAGGASTLYLNQKITLSTDGSTETNVPTTSSDGADTSVANTTRTVNLNKTIPYTNTAAEVHKMIHWVQANSMGSSNGWSKARIWAKPTGL